LEDEGIIFPLKSSIAPPHLPNIYNRNHNTAYFQSPSPAMPLYSTTVTNSPIAMMNYFNAPPPNALRHHHHQQQQQQHSQQQFYHHQLPENSGQEQPLLQHIPVNVVSSLQLQLNGLSNDFPLNQFYSCCSLMHYIDF
jgi:hypothetical protein